MKREKKLELYVKWAVFQKGFNDKPDFPIALFMNWFDADIFIQKSNEEFGVSGVFYIEKVNENTILLGLKEGDSDY